MRKLTLIACCVVGSVLVACNNIQRTPNDTYMPDMAYSRSYETYADHSNLAEKGISYNNQPVVGTVARGSDLPFHIPMDAVGDTANYVASKAVKSPVLSLTDAQLKEAERLYLINCGICHGTKLDGNGPLYKDGNGPYPAKPATLVGDAKYESMPEGQMFYSLTYGKNLMGSYAAQLNRKQRWDIIYYIKVKQGKIGTAAPAATNDSTATAKK